MADRKNNITNSKDYLRYLNGKMTAKERNAFERNLLEDEFESEALEGYSELDSSQIAQDLDQLKDRISLRKEKKNSTVYWKMAAAILLVGVFSFVIYLTIDLNSTSDITLSKRTNPIEETVQADADQSPAIAFDSMQENEPADVAVLQKHLEEEELQPNQEDKSLKVTAEEEEDVMEELAFNADKEIIDADQAPLNDESQQSISFAEIGEVEVLELSEPVQEDQNVKMDRIAAAPAAAKRVESTASHSAKSVSGPIKIIAGKIYSGEDEEGIPGVNVIIKGVANGTVSDSDGEYTIEVPADANVTLSISSIGYISEEIEVVGEQSKLDIVLNPDMTSLSEIVVTAYGKSSSRKSENDAYTATEPSEGTRAFKRYIKENIQYPVAGLEERIKGIVTLKFTIGADGTIQNLEVTQSLGSDFDKEAIRLLMDGPQWNPATENGRSVASEVTVKVRFKPPK